MNEKPHIVKRNGAWFIFRNRQDARVWPWAEACGCSVADACARYRTRRKGVGVRP